MSNSKRNKIRTNNVETILTDSGVITLKRCCTCKKMKNDKTDFSPNTNRCKSCNNKRNRERNLRGYIPKKLKKEVLSSYSCCQICGISEIELKRKGLTWHVDHKLPAIHCEPKKGNHPCNLWKLCSDCNESKSGRIIPAIIQTIPFHVYMEIATKWFRKQVNNRYFKQSLGMVNGRSYIEFKLNNKRPDSEKNITNL